MIKNKLSDMVIKDTKVRGIYRGVVESVEDPLESGRIQCRIHGLHTLSPALDIDERDGIPTEHLPWCDPAIPITEFGPDGSGIFGVPKVGSHVLIFFENENLLNPIYFAAVPAKTEWNTKATSDNFVIETSGGHYVEFDSTSGSERIKVYHTAGTSVEIGSSGEISVISAGDVTITITGNCTISTTGVINLN